MSDGYPVKAGQYLHTDTVSPLATTEGKLHVKAPDLESVIADLATDSRLELVRSLLASLDGKTATEETAEQVKSVLDAISDKVASETTLTQAVEKLNDLLDRLDQKLTIDGEVQLKGSDVEDENPIPVKTVAVKSTYMTILNTSTVVNPGESIVTPLQDLSDCQEISLAVRLQSAAKWSAAWQGRTPSNLGLASSHSIDHESSPAPYDAVRAPLLTTHGYAVVRNRDVNPITVTQVAVVKWMTGGMIQ